MMYRWVHPISYGNNNNQKSIESRKEGGRGAAEVEASGMDTGTTEDSTRPQIGELGGMILKELVFSTSPTWCLSEVGGRGCW